MAEAIKDGTGGGNLAKVGADNQLWVRSKSISLQHAISEDDQDAYQVWGTATLASGTTTILHIVNNSADKNLVINYIRLQILDPSGGTNIPNASNYFSLGTGRTYSTGGTEVTPTNMFLGDGKLSAITVYNDDPTLAGTDIVFDRWYPESEGKMYRYQKEGALIIPTEKSLEISFQGDQTGGIGFCRISYVMEEAGK